MIIKKILMGTGILVGLYLLVSHATEAGKLLTSTEGAYAGGVKVLQGR